MKKQIYIPAFGYAEKRIPPEDSGSPPGLYTLCVATVDGTRIQIGTQKLGLNKYDVLICESGVDADIYIERGQAMYIVLSGFLASQYIADEKKGVVLAFSAKDPFASHVGQLKTILDYKKRQSETKLTELGFGLLLSIWSYRSTQPDMPQSVRDAIAIIDNEYGMLYGLDDLAERVGVSKSHLIRLFRTSLQITPGAYLEETRIEKAKMMLEATDLNLETLAQLCGYANANYFGKVFKKRIKICPSEYARRSAGVPHDKLPDELFV